MSEALVHDAKTAEVAGFRVRRALPRRGIRTVGAWCFADHMGPELVTETSGLDVGPHPHIGLQTVTWLMEGAVLHTDSLGSEQLIRPGQLNLMTAGRGIVHAEESVRAHSTSGSSTATMHGVQLWIAQPSATRDGAS
ncbi:MAG: pirin family protein, partial [Candidatus Nanopelagicales bacterium]